MGREVPESTHPLTQYIASFMEDPKERDTRYANHMLRMKLGCERFLKDKNLPMFHADSHRPKPLPGCTPILSSTTKGKGDIQKSQSLDAVLAYHEKLAKK